MGGGETSAYSRATEIISGFGQTILNFLPRCCHTGVYQRETRRAGYWPLDFDWLLGEAGPIQSLKKPSKMSDLVSIFLHLLLFKLVAPVTFRHHRYDDLVRMLYKVHNECPHITRVYSIGRSVKGRHLYVLEFSDYPGIHEPCKPSACVLKCVGAGPLPSKSSNWGGFWEGPWTLYLRSITTSPAYAKYFLTQPSSWPNLWRAATPIQAPVCCSCLGSVCSRP